jgi:hypothetical protein
MVFMGLVKKKKKKKKVRAKHVNNLCGQNVEFLNVKSGGTYNYHCTLKC